jgi:predicted lipid-binding transport protein (Tim44 family)
MSTLRERLEVRLKNLETWAKNAERMVELLRPEFDAFEARTGHNTYVVRDYVDHQKAAREHRQEMEDIKAILAAGEAASSPVQPEVQHSADPVRSAGRNVLRAWAKYVPIQNAAMHETDCDCLRCEMGRLEEALSKT